MDFNCKNYDQNIEKIKDLSVKFPSYPKATKKVIQTSPAKVEDDKVNDDEDSVQVEIEHGVAKLDGC